MPSRTHGLFAVGALAIVIAGALLLQRRITGQLRSQIEAALAQRARLASRLIEARRSAAKNDLKNGSAVAHGGLQPFVVTPVEGPSPLRTAASWRNVGRGTPEATTETLLWATAHGDLDAMADGIYLDPTARGKADALWRELPEESRGRWSTPEKLVALFVVRNALAVAAAGTLRDELVAPDQARLQLILKNDAGDQQEKEFSFRLGSGGWQLEVPEKMVDTIAAAVTQPSR